MTDVFIMHPNILNTFTFTLTGSIVKCVANVWVFTLLTKKNANIIVVFCIFLVWLLGSNKCVMWNVFWEIKNIIGLRLLPSSQ